MSAKTPWSSFVEDHPRWSDVADAGVPCAQPAPRPTYPPHPLFAPWHREIVESAPTSVGLVVPSYWKPDPFEPSPADCFAHGRIAFLDEPRWPSCGACGRQLEMCVQIAPAVLADFLPGGRGLVALFCVRCDARRSADRSIGYVRLVEPRYRVVIADDWEPGSGAWLSQSQRVTPCPPRAAAPPSFWVQCRSLVTHATASSALLGHDPPPVTGPFPPGVDPACLDDLAAEYDRWINEKPPYGDQWGLAWLGGVAGWDEVDKTPSCAHGEMRHLLDYNGVQFGDGALHVFACRANTCALDFVAEF